MSDVVNSTTMFGQWLRQRRRSLDLTQTELARQLGCSVITVRKIEQGERRPSRQMTELLAEIVGIVPEERMKFIQFARRDHAPDHFQHPVFNPSETSTQYAPEDMFPADFPGWIEVTHPIPAATLSKTLLTLKLQSAPIDSPRSECLADGRQLCKIYSKGHVSGSLNGVLTQEISHLVDKPQQPALLAYLTVYFTIETDLGIVKGYYTGFSKNDSERQADLLRMRGQVLSVTSVYIDLFLADVFYEGSIHYPKALPENAIFEQGVITILSH
jgi:transcriptional regulator with XRE-family HTH domain